MARLIRRPLLWGLLTLTVLTGAAFARPDSARHWGLDFWSVAGEQRAIEREKQFDKELTAQQTKALWRIAIKDKVTRDLVEGRVTLSEAVARFRQILAETPLVLEQMRYHDPGASDDELICLNVIRYAELIPPAGQRPAYRQYLDEQMCAYLAEVGR
jgi:hypothetical protein